MTTTIHDLGGAQGWGAMAPSDPDEQVFGQDWEKRAFALALLSMRLSGTSLDAFRYSMSRLDEQRYFADGYYGRWLNGAENLLLDSAIIAPGAIDARARRISGEDVDEPAVPEPAKPDYAPTAGGSLRVVEAEPAFAVGDRVRAKGVPASGHTRLTSYVAGREGVIDLLLPAQLLPDTHAHFQGENPQHVYSVRFSAEDLWGPGGESFDLNIDLYESYLEAVR